MRKRLLISLCCFIGGVSMSLSAQEISSKDSLKLEEKQQAGLQTTIIKDTVALSVKDEKIKVGQLPLAEFSPNPKKAVLYSVLFPGLGQFYNRKYWKIPIIFGGALGLTYAITWNGDRYSEYKEAYRDFVLDPYRTTSWEQFISRKASREDYLNNPANKQRLENDLKRRKDFFRRNRDLAIIATVGVYALCIIDAYVDAQLYNFDMSPDISMQVYPVVWGPTQHTGTTFGLQCSVTF